MIDTLRLRQVDLFGYQTGSLVAADLAASRPAQVRRVVLAGVPVFDAKEREAFHRHPWPVAAREDGTHLVEEWQRIRRWRAEAASVRRVGQALAASLQAGDAASWGPAAAADYSAGERLPLVHQPVLVLRPKDEYWEMTPRADALLPEARRVDLPEQDAGLLDAGVHEVVRYAREFLDR
jgi:pimeloyl-ACP methyl ester carboxylesterase